MARSDIQPIVDQYLPVIQRLIQEQSRFSEPFRNRFDHTLRVLIWAGRIQELEGGDREIVSLAVLFHDVGWSETENHALISASLAEETLQETHLDRSKLDRILSAVRTHNERKISREELPLENRIVMDADFLDELGVTTMVWDALKVAGGDNPSYLKVYEKDHNFYLEALKKRRFLKTDAGIKFYDERLNFWKLVLDNLKFELGL